MEFMRHRNIVNPFRSPRALRAKGKARDSSSQGIMHMTKNLPFLIFSVVNTKAKSPLKPQKVFSDFNPFGMKAA